jgi:hypothetical protein
MPVAKLTTRREEIIIVLLVVGVIYRLTIMITFKRLIFVVK